jgi:hypothetical protein
MVIACKPGAPEIVPLWAAFWQEPVSAFGSGMRPCFVLLLWFLFWSAAVLCSAALVSRLSFPSLACRHPRASGCTRRKKETGQTKAAEQSTAALQKEKQAKPE